MARRERGRRGAAQPPTEAVGCAACNSAGSGQGRLRDGHLRAWDDGARRYAFGSAEEVEAHLRLNVAHRPAPEKGYTFDEWVAATVAAWQTWHAGAEQARAFAKTRADPWPPPRKPDSTAGWMGQKYPADDPRDDIDPDWAKHRTRARSWYTNLESVRSPKDLIRLSDELLKGNVAAPRLYAVQMAVARSWQAHNSHDPTWRQLLGDVLSK